MNKKDDKAIDKLNSDAEERIVEQKIVEKTEETGSSKEISKRRQKDQFFMTLIGLVVYSVILIIVVIGTFFIVKGILKKYDANQELKEEAVIEESAGEEEIIDTAEEEPKEEEVKEVQVTEAPLQEIQVTDFMPGDRHVDYSVSCFKAGIRTSGMVWQDLEFSRLEQVSDSSKALINSFDYSRKSAILNDEKPIVYEIFSDPETQAICKITTTEYCGDTLSIRDYYYHNERLNYADQYQTVVKLPVDVTGPKIQSRYYISADCLVKYSYCENNKATVYTLDEYEKYSEGTKEQYDYLEQEIINYGYITYYAAKTLTEQVTISGYVLDEFNQPLEDAAITFYSDSTGAQTAAISTNGDGYYSLNLAGSEDTYTVSIDKSTLDNVKIYGVTAGCATVSNFIPTVYMSYSQNGQLYNTQLLVRDAIDNNVAMANAEIRIRSGFNNRFGDALYSGVLDSTGNTIVPLKAGCYTAEVDKGGYENCFFNVIVKLDRQAAIGFAVPDRAENQLTAVLSWDTTPLDLDSRLIDSYGVNINRSSVDSIGAIMCESTEMISNDGKCYEYYISDYTDASVGDSYSYNMSSSGATVNIYNANGLIDSISVPAAHAGVIWDVFSLRNGKIYRNENYYNVVEQDSFWTSK